jgi:hypothetical protein
VVEKYFGSLKKGPASLLFSEHPRITAERRITVKDRIEMPRIYGVITPLIAR